MSYPEGLHGSAICQMEGCRGKGRCPNCGEIDYRLMGYYGAIARNAKRWGVTEDEAEKRMMEEEERRWFAHVARVHNNDIDACFCELRGRTFVPQEGTP